MLFCGARSNGAAFYLPGPPAGGSRPLTKQEKAWFFLLCGYQPKINTLIFRVF